MFAIISEASNQSGTPNSQQLIRHAPFAQKLWLKSRYEKGMSFLFRIKNTVKILKYSAQKYSLFCNIG